MIPLRPDDLDHLKRQLSILKEGVHCFTSYRMKSGKDRTVQGLYSGIDDEKIVLVHNGRKNRIPMNRVFRMTHNLKQQGGKIGHG